MQEPDMMLPLTYNSLIDDYRSFDIKYKTNMVVFQELQDKGHVFF